MINFILVFIFASAVLLSLFLGLAVFYHFKRFGLVNDPNKKKLFKIFIIGCSILIVLSFIFLILILF